MPCAFSHVPISPFDRPTAVYGPGWASATRTNWLYRPEKATGAVAPSTSRGMVGAVGRTPYLALVAEPAIR